MGRCEIVDTFPAFLTCWAGARGQPLDHQITAWAEVYLSQWPELLAKQIDDYASQGLDWQEIAREKVFPTLEERLPAMQEAHRNLLGLSAPTYATAQQVLGFDCPANFVLHVGIGCGAGWVTPFGDLPAILFGLESIAECGWSDAETLAAVMAHEIGHLAHHHWRALNAVSLGSGPWWQLYEEGFAEWCEGRVLQAPPSQPVSRRWGADWLAWCRRHEGWLAAEFLEAVDAARPVTPFFGSWSEVRGRSETGYYLGRRVIEELERHIDLAEIALLDSVEARSRPIVERMAG